MDKLEQIMSMQAELQRRLGTDFSDMSDEDRAAFMRNHRGYLADEVAEALYEMPNYKLWKDYSNMSEEERAVAWQKVRMELIDSLHFFVNLLLCAGMTAEEVCDMYMAKNAENHRRQDAGYNKDVSYREQSVEDVMKMFGKEDRSVNSCTVAFNDATHTADSYVAVLIKGDDLNIYYSTDKLSLGRAAKLATEVFYKELKLCDNDTRVAIEGALFGGDD